MDGITFTPEFRKTFITEYSTAIKEGNIEKVERIINDKNINLNFEQLYGLSEAVRNNDLELVKYFLTFVDTNIEALKCIFRSCITSNNHEYALLISQKIKNIINEKPFESDFDKNYYYFTQLMSEVNFMKEIKVDYSLYF